MSTKDRTVIERAQCDSGNICPIPPQEHGRFGNVQRQTGLLLPRSEEVSPETLPRKAVDEGEQRKIARDEYESHEKFFCV